MPIACQEQLNSPGRQLQCESHLGAKLLPDHHTHVTVKLPTLHSKATYIKSVLTECLKKKKEIKLSSPNLSNCTLSIHVVYYMSMMPP